MNCIFCDQKVKKSSLEHIVPESLGNKLYTLEIGAICGDCNNRFSKFDAKAITNTILGHERSRLNVETKKGKPGTGQTGHLKTSAMPSRGKNFLNMEGLKKKKL